MVVVIKVSDPFRLLIKPMYCSPSVPDWPLRDRASQSDP